jgi:uncharacterized protein
VTVSRAGPMGGAAARDGWVWLSLLPLGLGSWAPIVAGVRYRVRSWTALGLFWVAVTLTGLVLSGSRRHGSSDAAGVLLWLAWGGGIVTSFVIRGRQRRRVAAIARADADGVLPAPDATGATIAARTMPGRRDRWPWISLLPFGLGSWAPIVAAIRCRVASWALLGVAGVVASVVGFALAAPGSSPGATNHTQGGIGGLLLIGSWLGGITASFAIRPRYDALRGCPPRPRPDWPRPTAASLEWSARYALIAYAVSFIAVIALSLLLDDVLEIDITVGVGVLLVDVTLLAGLVPLARKRGLALADLGLRPTLALRSLWLVVQALLIYLVVAALWSVAFISRSATRAAGELSQIKHVGTFELVVAVVAVSLVAPTVEEIFFRGLLYRSLRNRLPVAPAALVAGVLFGLVHIIAYPLVTLPIKAAFGVIACLLYERTGSILPGIALHSFIDASVVDVALTGNDNIVLIVAGTFAAIILLRAAVLKITNPTAARSAGVAGDTAIR